MEPLLPHVAHQQIRDIFQAKAFPIMNSKEHSEEHSKERSTERALYQYLEHP